MAHYSVGDEVDAGVVGTVRVLAAYDGGTFEFEDDRYDVETAAGAVLLRVPLPTPEVAEEAPAVTEPAESVTETEPAPTEPAEAEPAQESEEASSDGTTTEASE